MPIYEYQCTQCEHSLEALQKIADAPLTDCLNAAGDASKKFRRGLSPDGYRLVRDRF